MDVLHDCFNWVTFLGREFPVVGQVGKVFSIKNFDAQLFGAKSKTRFSGLGK